MKIKSLKTDRDLVKYSDSINYLHSSDLEKLKYVLRYYTKAFYYFPKMSKQEPFEVVVNSEFVDFRLGNQKNNENKFFYHYGLIKYRQVQGNLADIMLPLIVMEKGKKRNFKVDTDFDTLSITNIFDDYQMLRFLAQLKYSYYQKVNCYPEIKQAICKLADIKNYEFRLFDENANFNLRLFLFVDNSEYLYSETNTERFDFATELVLKTFILNQNNFKETEGIVIYDDIKLNLDFFELLSSIFPKIQIFCKISEK